MDNIMQYIPLAVSAVLLAALILTVVTNIITQVLKKLTWEKIPTNILAFLVAMAVTLLAFFAACQIMAWAVTWVHGGRSSSPGLVRRLRRYVWI